MMSIFQRCFLPRQDGTTPFLEDEIIRGYTDEMRDFMECVYYDREPQSGFTLAYDTIKDYLCSLYVSRTWQQSGTKRILIMDFPEETSTRKNWLRYTR